jgi:multimeric flavodoxin WrbA
MKILVFIGSPRKEGNSVTLAKQVVAGAEANGAEIETFFLQDMKIMPCSACDECSEDASNNNCIVNDDMQILYPKLLGADAIVIASPIYWFNMSAQTKTFIDRWYALDTPDGGNLLAGKRVGIILAYADPDPFCSGAVNALRTFQDIFKWIKAEIVGMVYGTAREPGEIRKNKELMENAYQLGKQLGSSP